MLKHPYRIILLTIPILFIFTFLSGVEEVDIQLHDTYFVFYALHITALLSIILFALWLIYTLIPKDRLVPWLSVVHILLTLSIIIFLFVSCIFGPSKLEEGRILFSNSNVFYVIPFLLLIQILLIVNIIVGFYMYKKGPKGNNQVLDD